MRYQRTRLRCSRSSRSAIDRVVSVAVPRASSAWAKSLLSEGQEILRPSACTVIPDTCNEPWPFSAELDDLIDPRWGGHSACLNDSGRLLQRINRDCHRRHATSLHQRCSSCSRGLVRVRCCLRYFGRSSSRCDHPISRGSVHPVLEIALCSTADKRWRLLFRGLLGKGRSRCILGILCFCSTLRRLSLSTTVLAEAASHWRGTKTCHAGE